MADKQHATLSPSGADRWMVCQGSVPLTMALPDQESEYATEGTDYHEVAALCLETDTNPGEYIGQPMLSGALVTAENAGYLQKYVDLARSYRDSEGGGPLLIEERVPLQHLTHEPGAEGTADAVILRQDPELIIADLKFGRGVQVHADQNRQLMLYALGVLEKHQMYDQYDNVRLVISQPRIDHVSEWVVSTKDLLAFSEEVKRRAFPIMERLVNPSLPPLPCTVDEKACRFCRAAKAFDDKGDPLCKALSHHLEQTLVSGFVDETTGKGELKLAPKTLKPIISVRGKRLGELMSRIEIMEDFIKAVRAQVEIDLLAGQPVEGWKLVQGKRGNRQWSDEEGVLALFKKYRMKKDEMYSMSLITPSVAEKFFKENPTRWNDLKELITQSDGKPSVAEASDKRPALDVRPSAEGFEVVDTGEDLL